MISARTVRRATVPAIVGIVAATALVIQLTGEYPDRRPPAADSGTSRPASRGTPSPTLTSVALPAVPTDSPVTPTSSPSSATPATPAPPARVTRPVTPSMSPTVAPTSPVQAASLDDLLRQGGPVPDGVPAQLDLFMGGGPICPDMPPPEPRVTTPSEPVVIPSVPHFCLEGFDTRRKVTVVVTAPDGTEDTLVVPAGARHYNGLYHHVGPGSPAGRHRVRATQGSTTAAAYFQAARATEPHLWVSPRDGAAGATVDVYIGGFPPGEPADLHLYVCPAQTYRATFTVAVDERGEAHLALRTSVAAAGNCYALNSPLVYLPPDPPAMPHSPGNQLFWLHDLRPPEQSPG